MKTSPANQMRLTSGSCKRLEIQAAVGIHLVGDQEQVAAGKEVMADRNLVRDLILGEVLVLPGLEPAEVLVAAVDVDARSNRAVIRIDRLVPTEHEAIAGEGHRLPGFSRASRVVP